MCASTGGESSVCNQAERGQLRIWEGHHGAKSEKLLCSHLASLQKCRKERMGTDNPKTTCVTCGHVYSEDSTPYIFYDYYYENSTTTFSHIL